MTQRSRLFTISVPPLSGSSYTAAQTVTITASASDNVPASRIEFYDGGIIKGTDTHCPFHPFIQAFSSASAGSHSWTARSLFRQQQQGSTAVSLTVNIPTGDTTPPTVSISSPASISYTAAQTVTITASTSDNVGVTKVEFYDGAGILKGTDDCPRSRAPGQSPAPTTAHTVGLPEAYDTANNNKVSTAVVSPVGIPTGR